MCLSIAYKNKISPENVIMKNVMSFECLNGEITFIDLMERTLKIKGTLEKADMVNNYILIKTSEGENQ